MDLVIPKTANNYTYNIPEDTNPLWVSGTDYATSDDVYLATTHKVYRAVKTLLNNTVSPDLDLYDEDSNPLGNWFEIGATNAYKAIDGIINTRTVATNTDLVLTFEWTKSNLLYLENISATSVKIEVLNQSSTVLWEQEILLQTRQTTGWYTFYFQYFQSLSTAFAEPLFGVGYTLRITLLSGGADTSIGSVIFGQLQSLGSTKYGSSFSIIDYSQKQENQFGDISLVQGNFRKRADFNVYIERSRLDNALELLNSRRSLPTLYIGDRSVRSSVVYGFYRDYNSLDPNPRKSDISIQVESLL